MVKGTEQRQNYLKGKCFYSIERSYIIHIIYLYLYLYIYIYISIYLYMYDAIYNLQLPAVHCIMFCRNSLLMWVAIIT